MFTYDIQYGGDPFEKYAFMGATDFVHFMSVITNFPWIREIEKANARPQGSSPTLSVKNVRDDRDLWISMSGDRHYHGYLIGYTYPKPGKKFWGFSWNSSARWLEIYLTEDLPKAKGCFKLFFEEEYEQLRLEIDKLEK